MGDHGKLVVHLKAHRVERGWTQEQLADFVGVTRQTILSIEHLRYSPSIELALKLARQFGVPVEALFQLEERSARKEQRRG